MDPAARDREQALQEAWTRPPGIVGWLCDVNHKAIGMRFIVTAFAFLLLGGVLALLMRTQLAQSDAGLLDAQTYNELFTLHGTTMMFLFAVPAVEGLAMYFMPLLLGTRDLPFPRLNAFGYWAYLFGGLFVYAGYLVGEAPDAGWFAYVPLAGPDFSPGMGMDFWLLGITLVEVAGIIGAIELIVGFLVRRAPGMTLARIPVIAWAFFVMAVMMLVAFPALVTASVLLEAERALGAGFYNPEAGGDPLLWQHLFWFFGHPEVYIMFSPAAGVVSMVVPVMARRGLVGYGAVVAALITIGLVSFGLWIHHMFTVGLPLAALGVFSASSFLIAIPSGIQIVAWLTTIWRGRPRFRPQMLFVLGFVITFVMGGITGVMVAAAPFDWVVHDSYFVVAHFHYVLIGGVLFPLVGGVHHWFPKWTGRLLGAGLGQASFWAMFAGLNLAFFPQHILGLAGMPRRIFTYGAADGWDLLNLLSTIGAYLLAIGVLLVVANVAVSLRRGQPAGDDPWDAVELGYRDGSLEWHTSSPAPPHNFTRPPDLEAGPGRDASALAMVERLAGAPDGAREALETTPLSAHAQRIVRVAEPSPWPLASAVASTVLLAGALVHSAWTMWAAGAALMACLVLWGAGSLRRRAERSGTEAGPRSTPSHAGPLAAALAGVVVAMVLGSLVFAYLLMVANADMWPPEGVEAPALLVPLLTTVAVAAATLIGALTLRDGAPAGRLRAGLLAAGAATALALTLALAVAVDGGPGITEGAYGAIVAALMGAAVMVFAGVLATLGVLVWHAWWVDAEDEHAACGAVARVALWVAAAAWTVVLVTVHLTPRLTDGPLL